MNRTHAKPYILAKNLPPSPRLRRINRPVLTSYLRNYVALMVLGVGLLLPMAAIAAPFDGCNDKSSATPCDVLQQSCANPSAKNAVGCQDRDQTPGKNGIYGPDGIITKVIRIALTVVGAASVVMIMVGGFKYIISSGDPANVKSAKNTILYAVAGLGLAILAQTIVIFFVNAL